MTDTKGYKRTKELLDRFSQGHLLAFYNQLDGPQKQHLLEQINRLDFSHITDWIENFVKNPAPFAIPAHFDPAPAWPPRPVEPHQQEKYIQARQLGEKLIADGKVAAFVVAGGQGTRLGFDGPKGNFPISPIKNKTLFRIFAESIIAAGKKYNVNIPWYIMTSPLNYSATIEIFNAADFFGMNKNDVIIFQQGTLPNFASDGRILLADKVHIASSPDGHGGTLKALYKSGALADMKNRGIQLCSYWQIDNPLVNILDTLFIGLHALENAQMSSKALVKSHPTEKLGNFCLVDGKVTVIEYSDLPDELANRRNPDGSLVFELGSIAIHIISTDFIEKLNDHGFALPMHRAVKKIQHIDNAGNCVSPAEPNGVKLETFIFDALPLASKSIILQTERCEEFAPVKNATGTDSPEVTQKMMISRAAAWLDTAGIKIPRKPDGSPDCIVEIAPGFTLSPTDLEAKREKIPEINPGDKIYLH